MGLGHPPLPGNSAQHLLGLPSAAGAALVVAAVPAPRVGPRRRGTSPPCTPVHPCPPRSTCRRRRPPPPKKTRNSLVWLDASVRAWLACLVCFSQIPFEPRRPPSFSRTHLVLSIPSSFISSCILSFFLINPPFNRLHSARRCRCCTSTTHRRLYPSYTPSLSPPDITST